MKIFIVLLLLLFTCENKNKRSNNEQLSKLQYLHVNDKDSLHVFWGRVHNYFDTIQFYNLYYCTLTDTNWKLFKTVSQMDSPNAVIYRNELKEDDSIYFFGVTCKSMEDVESDLHSCKDSTANPPNWAIIWHR